MATMSKLTQQTLSFCPQVAPATATVSTTVALRVPILPHTSPQAAPPAGLKVPLYPHQLRALHRCRVIESQVSEDGGLANDFKTWHHYKARGGVLADEVGTGKTATSIALVLSDIDEDSGDTLVVAPKHLISQWKKEIEKFADPEHLQVVEGREEYERTYLSTNKRRVVLVDVDTILQGEKLWYDWRQVYKEKNGRCLTRSIGPEKMKLYKEAALFSVKSAKGPCSYTGNVYVDSFHLPQRPWRRVIYDEIQDLVRDGRESQKNLLQLTRTAQNVWLLSATPFPHGNASIYANHELLGFNRLKMNINTTKELPEEHPFEQIKRKLYIRSPRHVADKAKVVSVKRNTEYVAQLDLERRFYQLEKKNLDECASKSPGADKSSPFGSRMDSLRQMTVHPEASAELRQVFSAGNRPYQRPVSSSVNSAAQRSIQDARRRLSELNQPHNSEPFLQKQLRGIQRSIQLTEKIQSFRQDTPLRVSVFQGANHMSNTVSDATLIQARLQKERLLIHDFYCSCKVPGSKDCFAAKHIYFRKTVHRDDLAYGQRPTLNQEFIVGNNALDSLVHYFQQELAEDRTVNCGLGVVPAIQHYLTNCRQVLKQRQDSYFSMERERRQQQSRIDSLSEALKGRTSIHTLPEQERLAQQHGSKPAALVQFLKSLKADDQVIIFSYWHDTLKLVHRTLRHCGLKCSFLDGSNPLALEQFTEGRVPIILLSAQAQASGANLQCANNVVILDPAGSSGEHGSTLEEQAIGRAARMGQDKPVTVTRFCVVGTLEEELFDAIDQAAQAKVKKAYDTNYVIARSSMEAPLAKKAARMVDTEVKVTQTITHCERLKLSYQQAQQAGDVIELLDDEDDNDGCELEHRKVPPTLQLKSLPVKVKSEHQVAPRSTPEESKETILPAAQTSGASNSSGKRSFGSISTTNDGRSHESAPYKQARTDHSHNQNSKSYVGPKTVSTEV